MDIPIVVVGYNRPGSLKRLLTSLNDAYYKIGVKLYISIDGGGDPETIEVADNYAWKFGEKQIIEHEKNIGLKNHILFCGNISQQHDGIILLEDDLFVSPYFYYYTQQTAEFYKKEENIAGISLYSHWFNETAQLYFRPILDEFDVYFLQLPSSWGQYWSKNQWINFQKWYEINSNCHFNAQDLIPLDVLLWSSSWKKYFIKYMIEKDLFFVYPRDSYTTNFGDSGKHHNNINLFQVSICLGEKRLHLARFSETKSKYDAFCEILPECLNTHNPLLSSYNYIVDLYGTKPLKYSENSHVLTSRVASNAIFSFKKVMIPHEVNVIKQLSGNSINFCLISDVSPNKIALSKYELFYYHRIPEWFNIQFNLGSKELLILKTYRKRFGRIAFAPFFMLHLAYVKILKLIK